jgi:glutamyl-tRNA reductase
MELVQAGVDHRSAPLSVRQRLAVDAQHATEWLHVLRGSGWAAEAMLLSTCNRAEAYVVSGSPEAATLALSALRSLVPEAPAEGEGVYVRRTGEDAALHLFRVAAGLESAILGETEIQGQVKEAHRVGLEAGSVGPFLDRLVRGALHAGKRARTETEVSRGAVSHGQAAVEVVRSVFGDLARRTVLVVGAGEMARLAALALAGRPGASYVVANRTPAPAADLAQRLGGVAVALEDVPARLRDAHVAVFATPARILTRAALEEAVSRRRDPLVILDYGVPRNVELPEEPLPGVFSFDLEAIEALMQRGLSARRLAVPAVETIVAEEMAKFASWHRTLRAVPAIRSLHAWAEEVRLAELGALPPGTSDEVRHAVDDITRRLVERLLRRPAARVRQGVEQEDPALPTPDHLRNLFGLPDRDDGGGDAGGAGVPES